MVLITGKARVTASPSEPDEVVAWDREKKIKVPEIAKDSQGDFVLNICSFQFAVFFFCKSLKNKLIQSHLLLNKIFDDIKPFSRCIRSI